MARIVCSGRSHEFRPRPAPPLRRVGSRFKHTFDRISLTYDAARSRWNPRASLALSVTPNPHESFFFIVGTRAPFLARRVGMNRLQSGQAREKIGMIVGSLVGLSLVVTIATGPAVDAPQKAVQMSSRQKSAAMQPLLRSATECIARSVTADPRFAVQAKTSDFGDLIVDSMPSCTGPVRAMIE